MGEEYTIPLVDDFGKVIGYGDRWKSHKVYEINGKVVLGEKHLGITTACKDSSGRVLIQHRKHIIFDRVIDLTSSTHPRHFPYSRTETLSKASTRSTEEDFSILVTDWEDILITSYSARDRRNPEYCENELLHVLRGRFEGKMKPNKNNVYGYRLVEPEKLVEDVIADSKQRNGVYAPWVHAIAVELKARNISL